MAVGSSDGVDLSERLLELFLRQLGQDVEDGSVYRDVLAARGGERERKTAAVYPFVGAAPTFDLLQDVGVEDNPLEDHLRRGALVVAEVIVGDGVVALDADLLAGPFDDIIVVVVENGGARRGRSRREEHRAKKLLVVRVTPSIAVGTVASEHRFDKVA